MPTFRYIAVGETGELQRGVMEAETKAAVVESLQRQGKIPVRAEPTDRQTPLKGLLLAPLGRRPQLKRQELADLTHELALMLRAGQDLDRALRFVVETAPNKRVATLIDAVREKVRGGSPLAAALALHPDSFPRIYIGLVRAGEAGGTLADTLSHLALLLERERALAATVQSAMIYPAFLVIAAMGSIILLLTTVLPQFTPMFKQAGAQLPGPTRLLIAVGAFVSTALPWFLAALPVSLLTARQALRNPAVRLRVDGWILRLPVVGSLVRQTLAARFTRTLGTLLRNGISLIGALAIAKDTIGNLSAAAAIDRTSESAKGGSGLARPLERAGIFPVAAIQLIQLGEETGQLAATAIRAAEIHEEKTRLAVQRLVSLLVPVITVVMGAAVAGIISALLLAMLSLNDLAS